MQAIILVLGAKILINLHQPLNLFFGAQYLEHFLLVAKNIVFHETKQFVIAGTFTGLKEGVESRFQAFELSCPRKDKTDGQSNVDDDFPGPRRADKLLALRKGFPIRSVMVCPVIIGSHTKEIVESIESFFIRDFIPRRCENLLIGPHEVCKHSRFFMTNDQMGQARNASVGIIGRTDGAETPVLFRQGRTGNPFPVSLPYWPEFTEPGFFSASLSIKPEMPKSRAW